MGGGRTNSGTIRVAGRSSNRSFAGALLSVATLGTVLVVGSHDAIAVGATFVVNSTGDARDHNRGDGVCATTSSPATSVCTLRAAIEEANANTGHDTIRFNIAGSASTVHRIEPSDQLPTIKDDDGVTIDGYTQPYSAVNTSAAGSNADIRIELKGNGPDQRSGLYFQSNNNVVRGLAVFNFQNAFRFWSGSASVTADNNLIVGNFIGTDAAGTFGASARTSSGDGVHLQRGASFNRIGAAGNANRNVISGSSGRGVGMFNPDTSNNTVENNIIGLNPAGTAALKNWSHGVDINYGSNNNRVENNVISGNAQSGIEISHDALGIDAHGGAGDTAENVIDGNLIGTDPTGMSAAAIYGNGEYGVGLEGRGSCKYSCPPDSNDNVVIDNVIVGSDVNVKIWRGSHRNVVRNNHIGVLDDGVTGAAGSTEWGVLIEVGSIDNLIEDNRISQVEKGIVVRPNSQNPGDGVFAAFGNTFRRNSIEDVGPGLGIDLAPEGSPTASPDAALVQNGVGYGNITSASTDSVVVSACSGCSVELFETSAAGQAYGQGRLPLGTAAAAGGSATFVFRDDPSDPFVVSAGDLVSALVTDSNGSTSEFSLRRTVVAGSIGVGSTTTTTVPATTTTTTSTTTTTVPATTTTTTTTSTSTSTSTTTTTPTTVPGSTTTTVPPSGGSTTTIPNSTTTSTTTIPGSTTTTDPGSTTTTVPGSTTTTVPEVTPAPSGSLALDGLAVVRTNPQRATRCSISTTC